MRPDETHFSVVHAGCDFVDEFVFHFTMLFVTPPDEDVGAVKEVVADALIRIIEAGSNDFPALGFKWFKALGDGEVDVLKINVLRFGNHVGRALGPDNHFALVRRGKEAWSDNDASDGSGAAKQCGAPRNVVDGTFIGLGIRIVRHMVIMTLAHAGGKL